MNDERGILAPSLVQNCLNKLDPAISELFKQRPLAPSHGDETAMDETIAVTQGVVWQTGK